MRSFLGVLATCLLLAGCTGGTPDSQPVIDWVKAHCGVLVDGAAVIAVTASGQPLAGAATSTVGNAICVAFQKRGSVSTLTGNAKPCAEINGICVDGEVQDQSKLDDYKPK